MDAWKKSIDEQYHALWMQVILALACLAALATMMFVDGTRVMGSLAGNLPIALFYTLTVFFTGGAAVTAASVHDYVEEFHKAEKAEAKIVF